MVNDFVVGVDADGVLTDMDKFNKEEGRKFYKREPVNPNGYSAREIYNGTKTQEMLYGLKCYDKYCRKIPLREDAQSVLIDLDKEGIDLHEITARKFTTMRNPIGAYYRTLFRKYLERYQLPFKSIQYCSEDFSPRDKYMACFKLDVDLMIEDKPEVALYLAEQGVPVLLFDAPYNQDVQHPNITRVFSWKECHKLVLQKRQEKPEIPPYQPLTREEKIALGPEERAEYIKSYRKYIKGLEVNEQAFKKSNRRFKLLYRIFRLPFAIAFRSKVVGKENIPYQDGFIIACNHLDSFDQFFISNALGERQFCGFAASTIKNTIRGRLFSYIGNVVYLDRESSESKSAGEEELTVKIAHNKIALVFPEGTRKNKNIEGRKVLQLKFKLGTVSMGQKIGAPILPMSLYHGRWKTYLKISELQFIKPESDLVEVNQTLENTIASMTKESIEEEQKKYLKRRIK